MNWKPYLKVAIEAALAAGEIQKKKYGKKIRVDFKGEIDLVTEVDKASEAKVVQIIKKKFPQHDFLLEEAGAQGPGSEFKWIVDPLDGTSNYAHGYPMFCVSIGLEYQGELVVGVVYAPYMNELFYGVQKGGAYLNKKKIYVSQIKHLNRAMVTTGFAYDVKRVKENNLNHFKNFVMKAQAIRRDGAAAIDLCYVACGRFDGFWERNLKPWDVAAGAVILKEAGGKLSLFDGSPLDIYQPTILASNTSIHKEMLNVLRMK